jgi:hypothetical protein
MTMICALGQERPTDPSTSMAIETAGPIYDAAFSRGESRSNAQHPSLPSPSFVERKTQASTSPDKHRRLIDRSAMSVLSQRDQIELSFRAELDEADPFASSEV